MPVYKFSPKPETVWLVLTALVGVVATAVATQGATPPTDPHAWAIGLAAGLTRTLLGLVIGALTAQTEP